MDEEKALQLTRLPRLAVTEVIKCMVLSERIKLAVLSKRMKHIITHCKSPSAQYILRIKNEESYIHLKDEDFYMFCGKLHSEFEKYHIKKTDMKGWINLKGSPATNMVKVLLNLLAISKCESYTLLLDFKHLELADIRQVLSLPELSTKRKMIKFEKAALPVEKTSLDKVMELADKNTSIEIKKKIPEDYSHENAFKFHNMKYSDGRWVLTDNLITLENSGKVHLGSTRLNYIDINNLINHWIRSDCDMFEKMKIEKYGTGEVSRVFRGTAALRVFKRNVAYYLICSCSSKTERKQTILCGYKSGEDLCLNTYTPETCPSFFRELIPIINLIIQKKSLERELRMVNLAIAQANSTMMDVVKSNVLPIQINDIQELISTKGVFLDAGFYTHVIPRV